MQLPGRMSPDSSVTEAAHLGKKKIREGDPPGIVISRAIFGRQSDNPEHRSSRTGLIMRYVYFTKSLDKLDIAALRRARGGPFRPRA